MIFNRTIKASAVREAIDKAARHLADGSAGAVMVVHDECLPPQTVAEVLEALADTLARDVFFLRAREAINWSLRPVFVYAYGWSTNGLPVIRTIVDCGAKYYPVAEADPKTYVDRNAVARQVLEAERVHQAQAGFAKWDFGPGDFINICQFIETTRGVAGDYVEIGCFNGSSGAIALHYMRAAGIGRTAWFFDVFEGFTYAAAKTSSDATWVGTHRTDGRAAVAQRLGAYAGPGLAVHVAVNNIITDPLPAAITAIAVANIDVDIYEGVLAALRKVRPLLARGGVMIVEDDGHTPLLIGARLAVEEFAASPEGVGLMKIAMESGQTVFVNLM